MIRRFTIFPPVTMRVHDYCVLGRWAGLSGSYLFSPVYKSGGLEYPFGNIEHW
jgi:hypothetical protein